MGGTGGRFALLANEDAMEEDRSGELEYYADSERAVTEKDEDIRPEDRMDALTLDRVRAREGTKRAVATLHANGSNMGLPEEVELVDENKENKRGKKRRKREETPADDLARRMTEEYKTKTSILTVFEQELMSKHGESALGVQNGLEAVLLHHRQKGEPICSPPPPSDAANTRKPMESNDGDVSVWKVADENRNEGNAEKTAATEKDTLAPRFVDRAGKRTAVGAEDAKCYRDTFNDHERVDRVFQYKYATLLPSIKCTMDRCDEDECVLTVFTKGF